MSHDPYPPPRRTPPPHPASPPYRTPPPPRYAASPPYRTAPPPPPQPQPPHLTYPWQPAPAPPPPAPAPRRQPQHAPLGHHSDLRVLRTAYRWQRRVATLTALGYFLVFLVLSACAPSVMTARVADGLPAGLLLALAQLPVTLLAIAVYELTARRHVDPLVRRIRHQAEVDARREARR
ncbi:DUF485 domain-containing protein [Streptomyces longwoodensis]|uniref:DUF485 domain-containing protein n=1 Tax=Streptomyces longwoodensis TaxID=68231 RepID=UPI0030E526CB